MTFARFMDLENGTSTIESVEDNEFATSSYSDHTKTKVKTNGSNCNEIHTIGTSTIVYSGNLLPDGGVVEGAGIEQRRNSDHSQPSRSQSPSTGSPPVPKGYGLRKWRRIKRDFVRDTSPNEDNSKAMKRVLSMSGNPNKVTNIMSVDVKQNNRAVADGLFIYGTGNESRFPVTSAFSQGTDSENSEDRSSKSSTAASAPRLRYDIPTGLGCNRTKKLSGKSSTSSTQRVQPGKGQVESSKKHRGERIKIEKENSHSSIESDSRSSNFFFKQGAFSVTSNRNQKQRSMYYDGANSNGAHAGEQQFWEDVHANCGQEDGEAGDGSQDELAADALWEGKAEKIQNHRPSLGVDPLVESIASLQSVQEALENEIRKFREIGRVSSIPVDSIFLDQEIHESSSSEQVDADKVGQSSISESQVLSLTENVRHLESRLEEAEATVKVKESRITELKNTLTSGRSRRDESGNTKELPQERPEEMETVFEQIFREKIEAEVEYLALSRITGKLRVAAGDQMTLSEKQEALAGEQTHMLNKIGKAEKKAEIVEKEVERVEDIRGNLGAEEVLKMQGKVWKVSWCLFIQLALLLLVVCVVLQLSPHRGVVPT